MHFFHGKCIFFHKSLCSKNIVRTFARFLSAILKKINKFVSDGERISNT